MVSLWDNPLFLQNWRERMRPSTVMASIILTVIILILIFLGSYIRISDFDTTDPNLKAFWAIAIGQGILLLLVATSSAHNMAVRERNSGTLDFHRASPTTRFDQVLGMLVGAPSLEWCLFLMTLLASLALAFMSEIGWFRGLQFYTAIIFCTLFFHIIVIFAGLYQERKTALLNRRSGALQAIVVFYLFGGCLFAAYNFSVLYHLTPFPHYQQIAKIVFKPDHIYDRRYPYPERKDFSRSFYGKDLPSLALQMIIQGPLLILLWMGTIRKISRPERPAFSKTQSVLMSAYILFLYLGSAVSLLLETNSSYEAYEDQLIVGSSLYLILALGIAGAIGNAPTQLMYLKGLRKTEKLNRKHIEWSEDHSSVHAWLFIYCMIAAIAYRAIVPWMHADFHQQQKIFILVLLYILSFAWGLAYFRLSRHHKKRMLFIVGVSILWFFVPLLGWTLRPVLEASPYLLYYFSAPSPLSGLGLALSTLGPWYEPRVKPEHIINAFLLINTVIAITTIFLCLREQKRLIQTVRPSPAPAAKA